MSFVTFILYIICVFIRPQDWVPAVYAWPLINILGISTLVFLFFESAGKAPDKRFVSAPQSWMMVGLFITIIMSHVVHGYFGGVIASFNKFLPTFILFFVIMNAINNEQRLRITIWLIVFMMVALVFQGMYQLENGYGWAGQKITGQIHADGGGYLRINWVGIFNDPNDLALIFVITIGFVISFVFTSISFPIRIINATIVAFLGYGIFLTNSRGGQLALMATLFFFFVRKTKKFFIGSVFGGIVAVLVVFLGPSRMSELSSAEESAANRLDLWFGGLEMFKSNPILGVGQGMFMEDLSQTAHNSYILAVAELGFVGLFLWVGLIYVSIKGLIAVQNTNKKLANYALGIQSALVGYSAAAFFLSRTYIIIPYMLFAIAGAVLWLGKADNKNLVVSFNANDARNVFFLCVGLLLAVVIMIRGR